MKKFTFLRRATALLLALLVVLPAVPAALAANEPLCDTCKRPCSQLVLKEANCHEAGVVKNICVNKDCDAYNEPVLKETNVDPDNHDTICTDNGVGKTHTAVCREHADYKNTKENHTFSNGYCTKCAAADYSQAAIVMEDEVEIYIDLNDTTTELSAGKVTVMVGNVDITKNYLISYSWLDNKGNTVSTEGKWHLPAAMAAVEGDYSFGCFVMAMPKEGTAGRYITASCTIVVHVRDMISVSAVVGSRETDFTLGETNSATPDSVFQQIYQAVYESGSVKSYPSYVVFDTEIPSEVGVMLVTGEKYYFTKNAGKKMLSDVKFMPYQDASGTYTITFTAYDTEGKEYPGVLTIVVERQLGELDVAYFINKGEAVTLDSEDFAQFWEEKNPGGIFKQFIFSSTPAVTEGAFYYNYNAYASVNTPATTNDIFYAEPKTPAQRSLDGVTFVPAGKFTGLVTVTFDIFGERANGSYAQERGEISIFVNAGMVDDVEWKMTNGTTKVFNADDLLAAYRAATGNKDKDFSIKILDVPENGALYIDYTGTARDIPLTDDTVTDYTFYYSRELSREIGDVTYVSNKSNKTLTDQLRYLVCDSKGEFAYIGEIILTCKPAEIVYTKSFIDVKKTNWYYTYVMDMAELGIIVGFEETVNGKKVYSFKAENTDPEATPEEVELCQVTYGQALKVIMLTVGYEEQASTLPPNVNVKDAWASGYLDKAHEDGLVSLVVNYDKLGTQISRQMIARIAALAMDLPASTRKESPFADVPFSSPYAPYILALYDAGIVSGSRNLQGELVFDGTSNIWRSELATIIWRIRNYMEQ